VRNVFSNDHFKVVKFMSCFPSFLRCGFGTYFFPRSEGTFYSLWIFHSGTILQGQDLKAKPIKSKAVRRKV